MAQTSTLHEFYTLREECKRKVNDTVYDKNEKRKYCDWIWDGLVCWPKTLAGNDQILPCPQYFGFSPKNFASKKCTENGTWYFHDEHKTIWTNYSQCKLLYNNETGMVNITKPNENLAFFEWWFPIIKHVTHVGYGLSVTTLIIAISIFCCFRKLQCARNRLHMHLFLSFSLKAFVYVIKNILFHEGVAMTSDVVIDGKDKYVKEHNYWICKAISSSLEYFIMTNYILILMEGVYLHNLLFLTLFSDKNDIKIYAVMGWGLPICFIFPWIIVKIMYEDELCWTRHENKNFELIIHVPIVISTLINFILFIKIVNILVMKLNSMYLQQRKTKYRRLMRSTLILMPLFGVPHTFSIMIWYYALNNQVVEIIWIFFDQTFTSLQGFFVAFLYCLLNNEVQSELKRRFSPKPNINVANKRNDRTQSFPMYAISRSNRTSITLNGNERRLTS